MTRIQFGTSCIVAWLTLITTSNLFASQRPQPLDVLDQYFKHVQATLSQLESKTSSAEERLKVRGDLVNGSKYWLLIRGKPGRAVGVVSFFQRKTPNSWAINPLSMDDNSASVSVHFDVDSFPGYPWKTLFELDRVSDQWLIRSFSDLTKRPIKPGADIKTVLDTYFDAVKNAVESLYLKRLTEEEKQKLRREYGFGAGFWIGQLQNQQLPAGTFFAYFLAKRPASWAIEQERIAGDYGEAVVHFTSSQRDGKTTQKTYTFELTQLDNEWLIAGHRSPESKAEKNLPTSVAIADPTGENPRAIAQQQLDLFSQHDAKLGDLAKASEPLWIDTRQARSALGRLIGMTMGLSAAGNNAPTWEIVSSKIDSDRSQVTAKAIWPNSASMALFSRVEFSLENTPEGWRLSDAQLLRN